MDAYTYFLLLAFAMILYSWWRHYRNEAAIEDTKTKLNHSIAAVNASVLTTRSDLKWHDSRIRSLAESHDERIHELESERKLQLELAGGGVWKTQSGYTLRIRDMSTNHLQNTLSMFRSRAHAEPFLSMKRELARREEDAEWQRRSEAKKAAVEQMVVDDKVRDTLTDLRLWMDDRSKKSLTLRMVRSKIAEMLGEKS